MSVIKIKDENDKIYDIPALRGPKGDKGDKGDSSSMMVDVVKATKPGSLLVEPNTIYFFSSLNNDGCSFTQNNQVAGTARYLALIVGQKGANGGNTLGYVIKANSLSLLSLSDFGNWSCNMITSTAHTEVTWDADTTIITIHNG